MKELQFTTQLFARLLLREIDAGLLKDFRQPETASALAELGIDVPDDAAVVQLGVEFCAHFLVGGEQVPLVESLWRQGELEGKSAQQLRALAEESGLEFNKIDARGAPVDHLGCILLLWSELVGDWDEATDYLVSEHLEWARTPLRQLAARNGFYPQVATATLDLIDQLQELRR